MSCASAKDTGAGRWDCVCTHLGREDNGHDQRSTPSDRHQQGSAGLDKEDGIRAFGRPDPPKVFRPTPQGICVGNQLIHLVAQCLFFFPE